MVVLISVDTTGLSQFMISLLTVPVPKFAQIFVKVPQDFRLQVFYESVSPKPLSVPLGPFRIFSKISGDICSSRCTTGINNTSVITSGVPSLANISANFWIKIETNLMLFSGTWGKMIYEKTRKQKILWHCTLKMSLVCDEIRRRCDGYVDCADRSDERACLEFPCHEWQFKCAAGRHNP